MKSPLLRAALNAAVTVLSLIMALLSLTPVRILWLALHW